MFTALPCVFCFFKQKTAYEMLISDWSSDVCSSDLRVDCRAVDGAVFVRGAIACVDIICEAVCNGMKGYCDGEISTNPRLGSAPITLAMRADIGEGLRFTGTPV